MSRFGSFFRKRTLRRVRDSTDNDVSSLHGACMSCSSRLADKFAYYTICSRARACVGSKRRLALIQCVSVSRGGSLYLGQPPAGAAVCVRPEPALIYLLAPCPALSDVPVDARRVCCDVPLIPTCSLSDSRCRLGIPLYCVTERAIAVGASCENYVKNPAE